MQKQGFGREKKRDNAEERSKHAKTHFFGCSFGLYSTFYCGTQSYLFYRYGIETNPERLYERTCGIGFDFENTLIQERLVMKGAPIFPFSELPETFFHQLGQKIQFSFLRPIELHLVITLPGIELAK